MPFEEDISRDSLSWRWRHFSVFSGPEWHEVISLRAQVFVLEQSCPYKDPDEKDPHSWHLELFYEQQLIGTLRSIPPGVSYKESSVGRVAVSPNFRHVGLGRDLMLRALDFHRNRWGGNVRLSAQAYLQDFYQSLGFVVIKGPYEEDDIPHLEMLFVN